MRVALLVPSTGERRGEFQYLPLGLAYIAAVTRDAGHEVRVFDARAWRWSDGELSARVAAWGPDVAAITATTYQIGAAMRALDAVRGRLPGVRTVLGGPHASALPREVLERHPHLDAAVVGEGEETFPELLAAWAGGRSPAEVRGIAYREDGQVRLTPARPRREDLDALPWPARELFPLEIYHRRGLEVKRRPMASMITSRGCPFGCTFCSKAAMGARFRARSPENVLAELGHLVAAGYREIHLMDDTFNLELERAKAICRGIIAAGWSVLLALPNGMRADHVDPELFRLMRRAGFYSVFFGVESGDDRVLRRIRKGIRVADLRRAVLMARREGFFVGGFFVVGLPGADDAAEEASRRAARSWRFDQIGLSVTTPYPGSRLYEELAAAGRAPAFWELFRHDFVGRRYLVPGAMAPGAVARHYRAFILSFYGRPFYYLRLIARHRLFGVRKFYTMVRSYIIRHSGRREEAPAR
jgi:radical SAM superfamily enzyme YgiQ (UPF0313 family)